MFDVGGKSSGIWDSSGDTKVYRASALECSGDTNIISKGGS